MQGTVLGIAVDWSAPPYLLCPFPGSSPSGRPRSVFPQSAPTSRLEKSCKQRFGVFPVGEAGRSRKRASFLLGQTFLSERRAGVGSERRSSLARPSGRRLDRPYGLSLGIWAGPKVARRSQRHLLGRAFAEKQVYEGPRVYELDRSPRALGRFG